MTATSISGLRQAAERFSERMAREYYLVNTRRKDNADGINDLLSEYGFLAADESIGLLAQGLETEGSPERRKRLRFLRDSLVNFSVEAKLARLDAQILGREREILAHEPDLVPLSSASEAIVVEASRERRDELDRVRGQLLGRLAPLFRERLAAANRLGNLAGCRDFADFKAQHMSVDLQRLEQMVESVIERTNGMYAENLERYTKKYSAVGEGETTLPDALHLFGCRACRDDVLGSEVVSKLTESLSPMGIDAHAGGNIRYEVVRGDRPAGRAFCYPLKMPSEVVLTVSGTTGAMAAWNFLHEVGHALHFGHVAANLPFEYKLLGDDSVTEGYGMLFGGLTTNRRWMRWFSGVSVSKEFIRFNRFRELLLFRRYAVRFLCNFRILFTEASEAAMFRRYEALFDDVCKVRVQPVNCYGDYDPKFYSVRYLRSWILAAGLARSLEEKWGPEWFMEREAGCLFKRLWSWGQRHDADELLEIVAGARLAVDPLVERYSEALVC